MVDVNNRTENHSANGIDYVYEFSGDGWIGIYEYRDGLPLRPIIQACNVVKANEYITMREPVPAGTRQLVPR